MLSTALDARARYDAQDYAGVVELLAPLARRELLAEPANAFLLADSARRVGGVGDLLELARATADAARRQDPTVLCDALNLEGVLLFERGHTQAAERTWCDLVEVATSVDEPQFVARASNNLGITAVLSMRLDDAIASFQRAVSAYLRLGYARGLAQSHTNLGIVFREMDQEHESFASFQRALTWAYTAESMDDVARAEEELALFHLYIGKDARAAIATARKALDQFEELRQPSGIAHCSRTIGVIAFAQRHYHEADDMLNRALSMAREYNLQLLQGETLLALAALAQQRASMPESFTFRQQAAAVFADIDAEPWGEQVARRMAQIS